MSKNPKLIAELRELLGADCVSEEPDVLAAHSGDKWVATHPPEVVVFRKIDRAT